MAKKNPLTPEELAAPLEPPSALKRAGNTVLGGIAAIGNVLDLPGSAVRDVISFRNPFDQWLSPTRPENRTTGRDLLRSVGVIGKQDTWTNLAPAVALEVALDPTTYLTFGGSAALTGGGKAARAAGILDRASAVATARKLQSGAAASEPMLTKAALATSTALTPGEASVAAQALKDAKLPRTVPSAATTVGRREARRTTTLKQLVEGLGDSDRANAIANLDNYARSLKMADHAELMQKFGNDPLSASGRVGIPLTDMQTTFESSALDRVGRWLDVAEQYVKWSAPGRAVRALFDGDVMGQFSKQGQELGESISSIRRPLLAKAAELSYKALADIEQIVEPYKAAFSGEEFRLPGIGTPEFKISSTDTARDALNRLIRFTGELSDTASIKNVNPLERAAKALMPNANLSNLATSNLGTKITEVIGRMKEAKNLIHQDLVESGVKVGTLDYDWLSHWARYGVPKTFPEFAGFNQRLAPSAGNATAQRIRSIAHLPAEVVESVLHDPLVRKKKYDKSELAAFQSLGLTPPPVGQARAKELIQDWTEDISFTNSRGKQVTITVDQQAKLAEKYARSRSKDFLGDRRMFSNSQVDDYARHMTSAYRLAATRDGVYQTLMKTADDMSRLPNYQGATMTIGDALKNAGYDPILATERMAKMSGAPDTKLYAKELLGRRIPTEVHDAIASVMTKSQSPEWSRMIGFYWDKASRVLKENLTLPFPGFWVRNAFSGQMMNMMSNHVATPGDIAEYFDSFKLAHEVRQNPEKYQALIRLLHSHDVYRYGYHSADIPEYVKMTQAIPMPVTDLKGMRTTAANNVAARGPSLLESAAANLYPSAAPNIASAVDPIRRAHETVLEQGRRMSALGEWFNRVPMFLYLQKKGFAPEEAAKIVKDIHVDYGDLAPFEKTIGRRAMLFYTFTRKQIEQTARRIYEQPGGIPGLSIAGTIKAVARARDPGELLPDYVAETASIPLGADAEGNRDYLTGFGLAFEDPLSFVGKGARGAGMELLSRLNPILKAPLEYATGESFFQAGPQGGRDLADADPLLGRTISNIAGWENPVKLPEALEVAISNSPASRLLTTTRQIFDPRKSLTATASNLLTGIRQTTISPAASEAILREQISEQLRASGARQFVRTYVPESFKQSMTPEQLAAAGELTDAMNELARRTKARKKIKQEKAAKS